MANPPPRFPRWLGWGALATLVLLVVAIVALRTGAVAYLHSESFRTFLAQRAGQTLRADVRIAPLTFSGLNFYGEGLQADGGPGAPFRKLQVEGVRAEMSLRRIFERVWQVESVHAERLQLSLEPGAPAPAVTPRPAESSAPSSAPKATGRGWLPNRVEIARMDVSDLQLSWKDGGVSGLTAEAEPQEGGWKITGAGGRLTHAKQPPLDVQSVRLLYRDRELFVQHAELRQPGGGAIRLSGDVRPESALHLHADFEGIALTPLLEEDWRVRLRGRAAGEVDIRSPLPTRGAPEVRGKVRLVDGELEALPVLEQIALFTRTQQFRRLKLSAASADFTREGERLEVRNLVLESARLLRVEGQFTSAGGQIDGTFRVGVTAASLQWLPGSQERIFTEARDGYLWAPMRLTGPIQSPKDDLTARLAAAAGEAVIQGAQDTVKDAIKTGRDVLKGALDLLLPPK